MTVREGRSIEGVTVAVKEKDEIVYVNSVKGRRARLVKRENNKFVKEQGKFVTLGWASLFTEDGKPLLEQIE